jgi:hypothetical protein
VRNQVSHPYKTTGEVPNKEHIKLKENEKQTWNKKVGGGGVFVKLGTPKGKTDAFPNCLLTS